MFEATANGDGTVDINHFGTQYHHWWVAEIKKVRGGFRAHIFGKKGGEAYIWVSHREEADALKQAVTVAQTKAKLED